MRLSTSLCALALLAAPVALASDDATLTSDARAVVETFKKKDANIEKFFRSATGWVVFPTIAKGGFVVAGAGGDGVHEAALGDGREDHPPRRRTEELLDVGVLL